MKTIIQFIFIFVGSNLFFGQISFTKLQPQEQLFSINNIDENRQIYPTSNECKFEVFVDTTIVIPLKLRSTIFPNEIDENGVELIGQKTIGTYKIIICNNSDVVKKIPIEDEKFVMFQEAIDSNGIWTPIEYFTHSGCASSYSHLILPNNYCVNGKIAMYEGDFETKIRVKILINEQIIYSNEFFGKISSKQFLNHANKQRDFK